MASGLQPGLDDKQIDTGIVPFLIQMPWPACDQPQRLHWFVHHLQRQLATDCEWPLMSADAKVLAARLVTSLRALPLHVEARLAWCNNPPAQTLRVLACRVAACVPLAQRGLLPSPITHLLHHWVWGPGLVLASGYAVSATRGDVLRAPAWLRHRRCCCHVDTPLGPHLLVYVDERTVDSVAFTDIEAPDWALSPLYASECVVQAVVAAGFDRVAIASGCTVVLVCVSTRSLLCCLPPFPSPPPCLLPLPPHLLPDAVVVGTDDGWAALHQWPVCYAGADQQSDEPETFAPVTFHTGAPVWTAAVAASPSCQPLLLLGCANGRVAAFSLTAPFQLLRSVMLSGTVFAMHVHLDDVVAVVVEMSQHHVEHLRCYAIPATLDSEPVWLFGERGVHQRVCRPLLLTPTLLLVPSNVAVRIVDLSSMTLLIRIALPGPFRGQCVLMPPPSPSLLLRIQCWPALPRDGDGVVAVVPSSAAAGLPGPYKGDDSDNSIDDADDDAHGDGVAERDGAVQ